MIESNPDHAHPLDRAGWSKSSYSESNGHCVEIKDAGHMVFLGDTKNNGHGPVVRFTQAQWESFLAAVVTKPASVQVDHVKLTRTGRITSITDTTRVRGSNSTNLRSTLSFSACGTTSFSSNK